MPLSAGIPAPDFELPDDTNVRVNYLIFSGRMLSYIFIPRMIHQAAQRKPASSAMIIPPMKRQMLSSWA